MKQIAAISKELGPEGASATGMIGVEGGLLKVRAEISYPIANVVKPATDALDAQLDKLKAAIPGTWDDALIDKFKEEYHAELVKRVSE